MWRSHRQARTEQAGLPSASLPWTPRMVRGVRTTRTIGAANRPPSLPELNKNQTTRPSSWSFTPHSGGLCVLWLLVGDSWNTSVFWLLFRDIGEHPEWSIFVTWTELKTRSGIFSATYWLNWTLCCFWVWCVNLVWNIDSEFVSEGICCISYLKTDLFSTSVVVKRRVMSTNCYQSRDGGSASPGQPKLQMNVSLTSE